MKLHVWHLLAVSEFYNWCRFKGPSHRYNSPSNAKNAS